RRPDLSHTVPPGNAPRHFQLAIKLYTRRPQPHSPRSDLLKSSCIPRAVAAVDGQEPVTPGRPIKPPADGRRPVDCPRLDACTRPARELLSDMEFFLI